MEINRNNYPNWLLKYMEGELSKNDKLKVEGFTILHEEAAEELRKLEQTRLQPDKEIIFPKKHLLMKQDETEIVEETPAPAPVRKMSRVWMSAVAIAAMLLLAMLFWQPFATPQHRTALQQFKSITPPEAHSTLPGPGDMGTQISGNSNKPKPDKQEKIKGQKKEKTNKKQSIAPVIKPSAPADPHPVIVVQKDEPKPDAEAIKKLVALNELMDLAKRTSQMGRSTEDIVPAIQQADNSQENSKGFFNNLGEFFRYRLSIGRQHEGAAYAVSFKTPQVDISKTLK